MGLILGIETSCDETAAAVVDDGTTVRSSIVATQHDLHERYAGVVPEIASRAHLERILPVVEEALDQAGATLGELDAVAVGHAPGLIGSLLVGVSAAKAMAWSLGIPLLGVHHLLAHLHAPYLDADELAFPALGLIASGGHTVLVRMDDALNVTRLGGTIDDAVGEAFDKAATVLGAGYPGGPAIERMALEGDDHAVELPIANLGGDSLDVSYAGLKTALLYATRGIPVGRGREARFPRTVDDLTHAQRADLAASFQRCAVAALIRAAERALEREDFETISCGGGVIANSVLRSELERLARETGTTLRLGQMKYCVDNAAMIAGLGHVMLERGVTAPLTLTPRARLPFEAARA